MVWFCVNMGCTIVYGGSAHRYHPCADSGAAKTNTRCPPKRVPSADRFFSLCRPTMQPTQSYNVRGQRISGQLTGKPAGPAYSPVADFFPVTSAPTEPPPLSSYSSYHLSSLDEIDLYTDRGGGYRLPSKQQSRDPRDNWGAKSPAASSVNVKCQGCGVGSTSVIACQKCDMILCPSCHAGEHAPCCGLQDFPKVSRPSEGYLSGKEKLYVYSSTPTQSQLPDKPQSNSKLLPSKVSTASSSSNGSRCGFCNKPGASHTCLQCSKVSCDSCMTLYAKDSCGRKNTPHNFVPNNHLNYKCSSISHLVYR
ncbi:UNVERIFIED_CONTAM: hypothetical protein FKN15_025425 [Acipenser sinensis]